ncbi:FAD-dependent oxidoreductase [Actinoplanes sp. NBRC 14428]|nr:FAD-dependent oxidoreductase [Actinoplanes sp. NBRC 14428]
MTETTRGRDRTPDPAHPTMSDVIIVGAGPVGMFLACELALAGCSVVVLERDPEPRSEWTAMPLGMRGLSPASVEAFYRRGMLEALLAASGAREDPGVKPDVAEAPPPRAVSHFAGLSLDAAAIDVAALPFRLPSPAMEGLMTSLEAVGTVLSGRAAQLGVRIVRGAEVTAVGQDDGGVVVRAGEREYAARWLVACDGGRSTVRGLAGFDFTGTDPRLTGYATRVTLDDPDKLRLGFHLTPTGMYVRTPFPGHLGMMDFDGGAYDRSQPPGREHLQAVLRRVSGTDVSVDEVHLASTFTDRAMQATTYRRGRVLLAGDSAHIHSPLGGQGLNLGIGDAMNLGWKLAATVRGDAPEGLLDTYTGERHPVGARVLDWSRAQVAVMQPGPLAPALQALIGELLGTRDGTTYAYERTSGTAVRYPLGGEDPLIGRNAPDLRLADGRGVGDLLRAGQGVALDLTAGGTLHAAAAGWADRVRYAAGPARNDLGRGAVLIRPDGVVAWAGERDPDPAAFARAATRWFGPARG